MEDQRTKTSTTCTSRHLRSMFQLWLEEVLFFSTNVLHCRNCKLFICTEHSAPARCVNCIQGDKDMDVTDDEWVSNMCNWEIKKYICCLTFSTVYVFHYITIWLLHFLEQNCYIWKEVNVFIHTVVHFPLFLKWPFIFYRAYYIFILTLQILFNFK